MSISLSFYIDFIPFSIEFGVDDVLNLFFSRLSITLIFLKHEGLKKYRTNKILYGRTPPILIHDRMNWSTTTQLNDENKEKAVSCIYLSIDGRFWAFEV